MNILIALFGLIVVLYFLQSLFFSVGARRVYPKLKEDELPSISIIVAARNEEDNILDCIRSLNDTIYPEDKVEIIVVNDHSTDGTGNIIDDYIKDKPKFKLIVPGPGTDTLKGKANAIDNAVKIAAGDVIITTDADCTVSPLWAKTIASYYTEGVGIVCGYTTQLSNGLFSGMQMVDFIFLLTIAGGAMNFGNPNSCIGNNMSFTKEAYIDSGGYGSIAFSVTEDFKLLMEIFKLNKYKVIYPMDPDALVSSKPCPDFRTLYHQKKRWGVGGLESDISGYYVMAVGVLVHLGMIASIILGSLPLLVMTLAKIICDYIFAGSVFKRLGQKLSLRYFISFEIYFILYVIALPLILLMSRKVSWKGREF